MPSCQEVRTPNPSERVSVGGGPTFLALVRPGSPQRRPRLLPQQTAASRRLLREHLPPLLLLRDAGLDALQVPPAAGELAGEQVRCLAGTLQTREL